MMVLVIGYIVMVAYSAGVFTWSVTHGRDSAAIGILLSISGMQLTVMETVSGNLGMALMFVGLLIVGRDVVLALRRDAHLALAVAQTDRERVDILA